MYEAESLAHLRMVMNHDNAILELDYRMRALKLHIVLLWGVIVLFFGVLSGVIVFL